MPSPARTAAGPCWRRSTEATCSWSRSTTAAGGTATTTSSPTCCGRACWTSSPTASASCTGGRATGTSATASGPRRSATRWPARTSSGRRTWSSWRSRTCASDRQEATLRRWLEALPDELIRVRPVLSVGYAGALMVRGEFEGVEARLRDAERWLDDAGAAGAEPIGGDGRRGRGASFAACPSAIAIYRAGQARILGDVAGTMTHARRALDLAGDGRSPRAGRAAALLGLAYWTSGDLDAAHRWYAEAMASLEKAGHLSDVVGCAIALADIRIAQGRLREAMSTYERGLQRATEQRRARAAGSGGHARGHERAPPRAQRSRCRRGSTCWRAGSWASTPACRRTRTAGASRWPGSGEAEGDLDGALDLLDEAERLYVSDFSPTCGRSRRCGHGCGSRRASWVRRSPGRGSGACPSTTTSPTCASSSTSPWPGCSWPGTRQSVQGARSTRRPGSSSASCDAAEAGGEDGKRHRDPGAAGARPPGARRHPAALAPLERALTLAEPEGYVRIFVDEGPPMAALLKAAARQGIAPSHVRRLLAAVSRTDGRHARHTGPDRAAERTRAGRAPAARNRPGRPGHRPRAHRVPEHRADPHQEHLRQARREQPPGSGPPGRGARPESRPSDR